MSQPADARQRTDALDLARSFIVQAPAGSGKTELLTQRFLKLLAGVDRPERILAITFTRRATREMRERITKRLQQARSAQEPEKAHEQLAINLARKVLERDASLGWNLLQNPGRLRINTIDGLCVQLLARDPQHGSHVAGRAVQEDARPLYRQAVQQMFEDLEKQAGGENETRNALIRLLVHLDGNAAALQDLLTRMMGIRDQWTRKLGADSAAMIAVLQDRQKQELERFRNALGSDLDGDLGNAMQTTAELGRSVDDPECAAALFAVCFDACSGSNDQASARQQQEILLAHRFSKLFMTAKGEARKPGGITRALFKGAPNDLAPLIPQLKAIYARWLEVDGADAALERMANTPPFDVGHDNNALREDICQVLNYTLAQLYLLFAEQGSADFQFMAESALTALGEEDQPGQVLLDEDLRLEHILMDEFQDTSNTQFELLSRLVAGWQASDGRSLLLVGDPMQSIYRFREANVGLFIDVVQRGGVGDIPLTYLRLESNFRSRQEIVEWVNEQFSRIFPSRNQRDSGAVSHAAANAEIGSGGTVQAHALSPEQSGDDEARLAVQLIQQAQQTMQSMGQEPPTIAVLARARNHLGLLAQALNQHGIRFEAVKVDKLSSRPVISDLLAITRALLHPGDRVAWLALLRAPWCGLNTRELHWVAGEDHRADLFERLAWFCDPADGDESALMNKLGGRAQPLMRLYEVIRCTLARRGSHTLRACVEYAWLHLGGPYCCATAFDLENAETYLKLLGELEREGSEGLLDRLNEKLGDLYASSRPASVQLMTIHQAKGLEFDVVIIPGLHRASGNSDKPLIVLQEFRTESGQDMALMAALPARGEDQPSVYGYLRAVDAERSAYETQRVLYVAATRARHQLHLIGQFKEKNDGTIYAPKGSLMELLLPAFTEAIENQRKLALSAGNAATPADTEDAAEEENSAPITLPLLRLINPPSSPKPVLPDDESETAVLRDLPSAEAAAFGDAVHQWLELIHDHWDRGWNSEWLDQHAATLASSLRRAGVTEPRIAVLLPELNRILDQAINSTTGQSLLDASEKPGSWSELELYRREGNGFSRHVIDLLYQAPSGEWHIVDHKTGQADAGTREVWSDQLQRYNELLGAFRKGASIRQSIYQVTSDELIEL